MANSKGTSRNDTIDGTAGADKLKGRGGDDTINGLAGADRLSGGSGGDILNGGAGSDTLYGGSGNDVLIYRLAENRGSTDRYTGGSGIDTLRLDLTQAEWTSATVHSQVVSYYQHLQSVKTNSRGEVSNGAASDFTFDFGGCTTLTVQMMERLQVTVAGVVVDLTPTATTIPAANHAPVITTPAGQNQGTVTEAGLGLDDVTPVTGPATATGTLSSSDADAGATATWSGNAAGNYGSFAIDPHTGLWTYTLDNANPQTNALQEGVSVSESFVATVTDDHGATATQTVVVTITGTNDAPVITGGTATGAVKEDTSSTATGQLIAVDPDTNASHSWTVAGGGAFGTLDVTQSGAWNYTLDNGRTATQNLAEGEIEHDVFTVQVKDEHGALDTKTVDVTVRGTNDAPFFETDAVSRGLTEDAGVDAGGNLTASGQSPFADLDLQDTHVLSALLASATLSSGGTLPAELEALLQNAVTLTSLDPATGDGHAQLRWDFALANGDAQFLESGETLTLVYNVTAADPHGGSATQALTITIDGAAEAPVITDVRWGSGSEAIPGEALLRVAFAPNAGTHEVTVDWGDSATSTTIVAGGGTQATLDHAYAANFTGTGTVTVTNASAQSDTHAFYVQTAPDALALARVSEAANGDPTNGVSLGDIAVSADGRYVLFSSRATNLVAGDNNNALDLFRKDLQTGEVTLITTDSAGIQRSGQPGDVAHFKHVDISADGRYAVFVSSDDGYIPGGNGVYEVYRKDLDTGQVLRVSEDANGIAANNISTHAVMSDDGRYVAFVSYATNLTAGDANPGCADVFLKDLHTGQITLVNASATGVQDNTGIGDSQHWHAFDMSADGRYVAFASTGSNLVADDTNDRSDVFRKDTLDGSIVRVSVDQNGNQANGDSLWGLAISDDGRYVAFASAATNLTAEDRNSSIDIFWKDIQTGQVRLVNTDAQGVQVGSGTFNAGHFLELAISADGRYVSFNTNGNLLPDDTGFADVYRKDMVGGELVRVSQASSASDGDSLWGLDMSADGSSIAFGSLATNFSPNDTNDALDIFAWRMKGENLSGGAGEDVLIGSALNDSLAGNAGNDLLRGNAGDDTLAGGPGDDVLQGGAGADTFVYRTAADAGSGGEVIADFSRAEGDVLNLHELLQTFSGYDGSNAFSGGYLDFSASGGATIVNIDPNGGGDAFVPLVTLLGSDLEELHTVNYVL